VRKSEEEAGIGWRDDTLRNCMEETEAEKLCSCETEEDMAGANVMESNRAKMGLVLVTDDDDGGGGGGGDDDDFSLSFLKNKKDRLDDRGSITGKGWDIFYLPPRSSSMGGAIILIPHTSSWHGA
jgi:hypothetical protein